MFLALALPVDRALDFTLKVGGVLAWRQGHLNVHVSVGLKFTGHWFELQVVSTHESRFLEVKFHLLGWIQVVQDNNPL